MIHPHRSPPTIHPQVPIQIELSGQVTHDEASLVLGELERSGMPIQWVDPEPLPLDDSQLPITAYPLDNQLFLTY